MNVLFLSALFPFPLYSGGQVRIYNLLKRLSKHHTITLLSFIREKKEMTYIPELSFCHNVGVVMRGKGLQSKYLYKAITSSYPLLLSTYNNNEMKLLIQHILQEEKIDLIHLEPGYVYPSLPETSIPVVVSEHNVEHTIYSSLGKAYVPPIKMIIDKDVQKLKKWEKIIWNKAQSITAVSDTDAKVIENLSKKHPYIIPNGIDDTYFLYQPKKMTRKFHALFVGNFKWIQNKDAVKDLLESIWPAIHAVYPDSSLEIVGQAFPRELNSLVTASIEVNSRVKDIRDAFNRSDVLLAPIHIGGGTKYKILEAMASGVPVITTRKGIEGLPLTNKKEIVLADHVNQWNHAVSELINISSLNETITKNARTFVESEYTWEKISKTLNKCWQETYERSR